MLCLQSAVHPVATQILPAGTQGIEADDAKWVTALNHKQGLPLGGAATGLVCVHDPLLLLGHGMLAAVACVFGFKRCPVQDV